MADAASSVVDFTVTNRPPSGKIQNVSNAGFQCRGKMFSGLPLQSKTEEKSQQQVEVDPTQRGNPCKRDPTLQRNVHSAKGCLERCNKNNIGKQFVNGSNSSNSLVSYHGQSPTSIIDINSVSRVPDYEEQMLINANKRAVACKQTSEFLTTVTIRPSSAKGSLGSPVVKVDDENPSCISNGIKPSVYGLRMGRQVYGSEPEILEAWKDINQEFPYKLCDEAAKHGNGNGSTICGNSSIPSTLHRLCPWLQEWVPKTVTGMDPSSCLVFLSHNYQHTDLPEVPPPQDPKEDLPYKCVVETPREQVVKKYKHPSNERDVADNDWTCKHSGIVKPSYNGDISNLLQKPYTRSPEKIRKEIQELEDLMHGVGSLASNCSFVQFQAEITQAKELAAKLYKLRPRDCEEPVDTFGLMKIYKDHELILAALQKRRNDCIQELALLELDL